MTTKKFTRIDDDSEVNLRAAQLNGVVDTCGNLSIVYDSNEIKYSTTESVDEIKAWIKIKSADHNTKLFGPKG